MKPMTREALTFFSGKYVTMLTMCCVIVFCHEHHVCSLTLIKVYMKRNLRKYSIIQGRMKLTSVNTTDFSIATVSHKRLIYRDIYHMAGLKYCPTVFPVSFRYVHHPQKHMKIYSNHHLNCPPLILSSLLHVFMYAPGHEGFFVSVLNVLMCVCLLSFSTCCKQVNTLKLKPQNNSCIIYRYLQS